jgi:hypothetical protein
VEENAAAVRVQLSPADIASLERLATSVAGDRYAEAGMRAVNR